MATVFRFRMWDITIDDFTMSSRWATRERIEAIGGDVIGGGIEVDDEYIGGEIAGMTARGFDPKFPQR